ncbi:uncharacterized protein LOC136064535 [Quercus suber]|uniref:uncharacterized protein LOC136064535 n=1 Tax=Quercus suber TaxID=58331 RepID=UPI0032DE7D4D
MVSSLIDNDTRWWKVDVINATFLPHEANTILKIPLNYNPPNDCLIWMGNKSIEFTIKSAYHIASGIVDSFEEGESTSSNSRTLLWKRIWQQKVPRKLKIFAWRICVNGLPTMQNLNHKGIHCSRFCPLCDKAIESTAHALLHCDHARMTWAFCHNCPVDLFSPSRDLWNRNQAIHEDSGTPPIHAWDLAGSVLAEFKATCSFPVLPQSPSLSKWKSPPTDFYKINTDAAAFDDGRNSCIGVVIRDNKGKVLAALSKVLTASFSAKASKALAMQEGVLLATETDFSHAIFESDALSIIQAINDSFHSGELGHIIRNIREVSAAFIWCSFHHLKREGKRVAHELARVARNSGASQVWKRSFLTFVEHLIIEDSCL